METKEPWLTPQEWLYALSPLPPPISSFTSFNPRKRRQMAVDAVTSLVYGGLILAFLPLSAWMTYVLLFAVGSSFLISAGYVVLRPSEKALPAPDTKALDD